MKRFLAGFFYALIAQYGCSGGDVAGGTGTETTNGGVAVVAGAPAGGALVRLIDTEGWISKTARGESVVLDSTITDSNGRFHFDNPRAEHYNVQIDHPQGALFVADCHLNGDTLRLAQHAVYAGVLTPTSGLLARALLGGSAYRATPATNGVVRFGAVAPGTYPIVALQGTSATAALIFGGARIVGQSGEQYGDTLSADTAVVPLDGFSTGFGMSELGYLLGGTWWYYYSDSLSRNFNPNTRQWDFAQINPYGGNTVINPELISGANGNTMLSATVVLGNAVAYPVGGIGISLGRAGGEAVNLSSMTAFSFRARGTGTLRLRLESLALDSIDTHKQYTTTIALPDSWTQFRIIPSMLAIDFPDTVLEETVPWITAGRAIKRIEFEFLFTSNTVGDTLVLQLDNLAFEGVSLSRLRK